MLAYIHAHTYVIIDLSRSRQYNNWRLFNPYVVALRGFGHGSIELYVFCLIIKKLRVTNQVTNSNQNKISIKS